MRYRTQKGGETMPRLSRIQGYALWMAKTFEERDTPFDSALKVLELAQGMCPFALAYPPNKPFPKISVSYEEIEKPTIHCTSVMRKHALEIVSVFQMSDTTLADALQALELTKRLCVWLASDAKNSA